MTLDGAEAKQGWRGIQGENTNLTSVTSGVMRDEPLRKADLTPNRLRRASRPSPISGEGSNVANNSRLDANRRLLRSARNDIYTGSHIG